MWMAGLPIIVRWTRGGVLVGVRNGDGDNRAVLRFREGRGGVFISEGYVLERSTIGIAVSNPGVITKHRV